MLILRYGTVVLLTCASLVACRGRTPLEVTDSSMTDEGLADANPDTNRFDGNVPDANIPDAEYATPDRVKDVWWFNTVRALCDTFAIEFCPDGSVAARFSFDDGCGGEFPTSDVPYKGVVTWQSDTEFEVVLQTNGADQSVIQGRFVESEDGPEFDRIEWLNATSGFPWSDGGREGSEMFGSPRPDGFVFCE